jgi:hypothetical protein
MRPAGFVCLGLMLAVSAPALSGSALAQAPAQPPAAPASTPIDLKLFEKSEVDRSKGCSLGLWQANRDPDKDNFAYVFLENMVGQNHVRQPARIKIGSTIVNLTRVATGGRNNGYALYEFQLYKMPGEDQFVVLELKLGPLEGEAVEVESGTMSIIMNGKPVFRSSVKGGAGCMGPPVAASAAPRAAAPVAAAPRPAAVPAPAPAPVQAARPAQPAEPAVAFHTGPFERRPVDRQLVARELKASARKQFGCEDRLMNANVIGFDMSEESAIWEIPCQSFAYQASSVFAKVYTPAPGKEHEFLSFQGPRGRKRPTEPGVLLNATWNVRTRTVTSISLGRAAGDCGVLERHRVTEEGTFRLIEYREKAECDGKVVKPEDFPLVYQLRQP